MPQARGQPICRLTSQHCAACGTAPRPLQQCKADTFHSAQTHPELDLGFDYMQTFLGSRWPEELGPEWANTCLDFQAKTHKVAVMVLEALAIALHMDVQPFLEVGFRAVSNSIWTVGPFTHTCYPRFRTRTRRLGVVHRFLTIKADRHCRLLSSTHPMHVACSALCTTAKQYDWQLQV